MKYRLKIVKNYYNRQPVFYDGELGDYLLDPAKDILEVTRAVEYRATVYQAGGDFYRTGSLVLRLDATQFKWMPGIGLLQSDRDHVITVTTDNDRLLWRGYAVQVEMTADAGAEWLFESEYNRLDDTYIEGDPDENRTAVPAQEILDEVKSKLPGFPAESTHRIPPGHTPNMHTPISYWFDVYRPPENVSARDYIAKMLTANARVLVFDANGDLEISLIRPRPNLTAQTIDPLTGRPRHNRTAPKITVRDADILEIQLLDEKRYMFNAISYTPFGADDETVYTGTLASYSFPGNHFYRYGRREIQMDFDHLSPADARTAALWWQSHLILPRKRAVIEIPDPGIQLLLLDRGQLEIDHAVSTFQPLWGKFMVTAFKIDAARDTIQIECEEFTEAEQQLIIQ